MFRRPSGRKAPSAIWKLLLRINVPGWLTFTWINFWIEEFEINYRYRGGSEIKSVSRKHRSDTIISLVFAVVPNSKCVRQGNGACWSCYWTTPISPWESWQWWFFRTAFGGNKGCSPSALPPPPLPIVSSSLPFFAPLLPLSYIPRKNHHWIVMKGLPEWSAKTLMLWPSSETLKVRVFPPRIFFHPSLTNFRSHSLWVKESKSINVWVWMPPRTWTILCTTASDNFHLSYERKPWFCESRVRPKFKIVLVRWKMHFTVL